MVIQKYMLTDLANNFDLPADSEPLAVAFEQGIPILFIMHYRDFANTRLWNRVFIAVDTNFAFDVQTSAKYIGTAIDNGLEKHIFEVL